MILSQVSYLIHLLLFLFSITSKSLLLPTVLILFFNIVGPETDCKFSKFFLDFNPVSSLNYYLLIKLKYFNKTLLLKYLRFTNNNFTTTFYYL